MDETIVHDALLELLPSDESADWQDVLRRASNDAVVEGPVRLSARREAGWNDILQRSTSAIPARSPNRRRVGRRRSAALIGVIATAVGVALVLVAPWGSDTSFAAKALSGIGNERFLRVVVEPQNRHAVTINLRTGRERAATLRTIVWYDSVSGEYTDLNYV